MKTAGTTLMVNVEHDLEVGPLKLKAIHQVCLYEKSDGDIGGDVDLIDYTDITYMGVKVSNNYDNWRKFCEFHRDMGIDFDELISEACNEVMTREKVNELIAKLSAFTVEKALVQYECL